MLPDRVSNPGPLTYESGALPIALRVLAHLKCRDMMSRNVACELQYSTPKMRTNSVSQVRKICPFTVTLL